MVCVLAINDDERKKERKVFVSNETTLSSVRFVAGGLCKRI